MPCRNTVPRFSCGQCSAPTTTTSSTFRRAMSECACGHSTVRRPYVCSFERLCDVQSKARRLVRGNFGVDNDECGLQTHHCLQLTQLSVPLPYGMRRSNSVSRTRAELRSRDCEQAMLFATRPELRVSWRASAAPSIRRRLCVLCCVGDSGGEQHARAKTSKIRGADEHALRCDERGGQLRHVEEGCWCVRGAAPSCEATDE